MFRKHILGSVLLAAAIACASVSAAEVSSEVVQVQESVPETDLSQTPLAPEEPGMEDTAGDDGSDHSTGQENEPVPEAQEGSDNSSSQASEADADQNLSSSDQLQEEILDDWDGLIEEMEVPSDTDAGWEAEIETEGLIANTQEPQEETEAEREEEEGQFLAATDTGSLKESLVSPSSTSIRFGKTKAKFLGAGNTTVSYSGRFGDQLTGMAKALYDLRVQHYYTNKKTTGFKLSWKDPAKASYKFEAVTYYDESSGNNVVDLTCDGYTEIKKQLVFDMQTSLDAFQYDYPEVMWTKLSTYKVTVDAYEDSSSSTGVTGYISVLKDVPEAAFDNAASYQSAFDTAVDTVAGQLMSADYDLDLDGTVSDREFCKAAHDYVCQTLSYDYAAYRTYTSTKDYRIFTAGPAFLQDLGRGAVCEGYARAFKVLCDKAGVPCSLIGGMTLGGGHMWNAVKLEGIWYLVDTTWDDNDSGDLSYKYYLIDGNKSERTPSGDFSDSALFNFVYPVIFCGEGNHNFTTQTEKDVTCTEDGLTLYICSNCGYSEEQVVTAEGHKFENHACTVCGELESDEYRDIRNTDISFTDKAIYSGTEIRPLVTVSDGESQLAEGTDYTLSYDNNLNAGEASVIVSGTGKYAGTARRTFVILPLSVNALTLQTDEAEILYYTGSVVTPTVSLMNPETSTVLVNGSDYVISSGSIDAGEGSMLIIGSGNYSGTREVTYTVLPRDLSETLISAPEGIVYTGEPCTPEFNVTYRKAQLKQDRDYTVTYSDNTQAGEATAVLEGKGNYTGEKKLPFNILPKPVSELNLSEIPDQVYTGSEIIPEVVLSNGVERLVEGQDYDITWSGNLNKGEASAAITGKGNYTGQLTAGFNISPAVLDTAVVTVPKGVTYTGNAISPAIEIKVGEKVLTEGTDYEVTFSDNVNAGEASVSIDGKGNYTGKKTASFKILPALISEAEVILQEEIVYTGDAIIPGVVIKWNGTALEQEKDYSFTVTSNTDAGTATVTITGNGNYAGEKTEEFTITPASVDRLTVSVTDTMPYTGMALHPDVNVKDGEAVLEEGTDYELYYSSNTNAGKASVSITGKGNYSGTRTETFTISPMPVTELSVSVAQDLPYTGKEIIPGVEVKRGEEVLEEGTDYDLAYSSNVNAGEASVSITGKGNYSGTRTETFTISPVPVAELSVSVAQDLPYTGKEIIPQVEVKRGEEALEEGKDYELSYASNTNAGEASVSVVGKGNYSGERTETFTITPIAVSGMSVTISGAQVYTGKAVSPEIKVEWNGKILEKDTDYSVSLSGNTNAGTAIVTITGKGNYFGERKERFTISPYSIDSCEASISGNLTYTGKKITPDVKIKMGEKELELGSDFELAFSSNISAGQGAVKITGKGNYTGNMTKAFEIKQKSLDTVEITPPVDMDYTGEVLIPAVTMYDPDREKELVLGEDYKVSYEDNTLPGKASVTIEGIGNYSGKKTEGFAITAALSCSTPVKSLVYTGREFRPAVSVLANGKKLSSEYYTVSYTNNKAPGIATIKIAGNDAFTGLTSETSFIITPKKQNLTLKLLSGRKMKLSWKKDKTVTGYQIQYAKKKSFSGAKTVTVKKNGKKTKTIKMKKGTWYFRIRAYKTTTSGKIYGDWSAVKKKKVS